MTWGSAAKTYLFVMERAQQAIPKVMFFKVYRYPTVKLYTDCRVLTVRLYILQTTLRQHNCIPPPERNKLRFPPIRHKTSFSDHQLYTLSAYLYGNINKDLNILQLNRFKVKHRITEWLLLRDYSTTETLLQFLSDSIIYIGIQIHTHTHTHTIYTVICIFCIYNNHLSALIASRPNDKVRKDYQKLYLTVGYLTK